jgi:hypothetical protein
VREQKVAFDVYPYAAGSTVLMPERLRPDVPVQITWSVPHPEMAGDAGGCRGGVGDDGAAGGSGAAARGGDFLSDGRGGCAPDHGA